MISPDSAIRWLADQIGADWLHLALEQDATSILVKNFLVTIRFQESYCQIKIDAKNVPIQDLAKHLDRIRDEFFMFQMHSIPKEEGLKLEKPGA
jgi:hypothetical protein